MPQNDQVIKIEYGINLRLVGLLDQILIISRSVNIDELEITHLVTDFFQIWCVY